MALQLKYQNIDQAYLKASATTVQEYTVDDIKSFITYVIYYIYTDNTKSESIYSNGFEMNFDPDYSLYEQIYNKIQELYPESIKI